jgi:hypothetical protein
VILGPGRRFEGEALLAAYPGRGSVTSLQNSKLVVSLIRDEAREAVAVVIGEAELGTRVGTLALADGAGGRGSARKIDIDQLADTGRCAFLTILLEGRHPDALRGGQDCLPHRLCQIEADREADLLLTQRIHEVVAGPQRCRNGPGSALRVRFPEAGGGPSASTSM